MENIENKRRKKHENIECVPVGFANGVAGDFPLSAEQKEAMIEEAAEHFGRFLTALKCDWQNDPNSMETPRRVAKAYVNDLWKGRYTPFTEITSFPSDGYDGIIIERNIQLTSAIHQAVNKVCEGNRGVIVTVVATHNCVSCRGINHQGAAMVTTKASGVFMENDNQARKEFFDSLKINNGHVSI
jgi:GTP cyclohydrolase I